MATEDAIRKLISGIQSVTGLTSPHIMRAIEQSGMDLATASPGDVYRAVTGKELLGPAQTYVAPPRPRSASRSIEKAPLSERFATGPRVQGLVAKALPAIEALDPALASRVRSGDPDAFMDAYRLIVSNKGKVPSPARQMELPLGGENEIPEMGLIPYGVRGPGVPVGGFSGPGPSYPVLPEPNISVQVNRPLLGGPSPSRGLIPSQRGMITLDAEEVFDPEVLRLPGPSVLGLPAPQTPLLGSPPPGLLRRLGVAPARLDDTSVGVSPPVIEPGRSSPEIPVGGFSDLGPSVRPGPSALNKAAIGAAIGTGLGIGGLALNDALDLISEEEAGGGPRSEPLPLGDLQMVDDDPQSFDQYQNLIGSMVAGTPYSQSEDMSVTDAPVTRDEGLPPVPQTTGLPKRGGKDTGFIETNSGYALKPAQQRTLEAMLDAGLDPVRAEQIVRGQRSLTQQEQRAIIANGPARMQRQQDEITNRRNARMGAY